jgi:two-component system cell cycle sensor histidine kinase/response regulator CckA
MKDQDRPKPIAAGEQQFINELAGLRKQFDNFRYFLPDALLEIDILTPRLTYMNRTAYILFGYTEEDLAKGIGIPHLFAEDEYERALEIATSYVAESQASGVAYVRSDKQELYEFLMRRKDGSVFHAETQTAFVLNEDGIPIKMRTFIRDVTDRKRVAEALRESEERYRKFVETSPDAIAISDLTGNITFVSPVALALFGGESENDVLGTAVLDWIVPKEHEKAIENIRAVLRGESPPDSQYTLLTVDGKRFFGEINSNVLQDADGNPTAVISIIRDVTERKQAEKALRESEEKLRVLFDGTYDLITLTDADATALWANPAWKNIFGQDLARREAPFELIHPDDLDKVVQAWNALVTKKEAIRNLVYRFEVEDGEYRFFESSAYPVTVGGEPLFYVVARDITERKQAEEALQASENRLRQAQQLAHVGYWDWYIDTGELRWSEEVFRIFGQDPKSFHPTVETFEATIHPADLDRFIAEREQALVSKSDVDIEHRIIRPDGVVRHVHELAQIIRNDQGVVTRVMGTVQDVTEHKQAEAALRESEEFLRQVVESSPDCIFVKDNSGRYILVNKAQAELYGTTSETLVGKTDREFVEMSLLGPEEAEHFMRNDREVIVHKQSKVIAEESLTLPDGTVRWFQTTKVPLTLGGDPNYVLGVAADITERKQAGEALRESEERFRRLSEVAEEGIAIHDQGVIVDANEAFARMFGYELSELIGMYAEPLATSESWKTILKHIATGYDKPYEGVGVRKDGSTFHCQLTGKPYQYGGKILRVATFRDITERKQAEEERERLLVRIREQAQRIQQIMDTVPQGVFLLNADGCIVLANPVAERDLIVLAQAKAGDTITHLGDHSLAELLTSPPRGLWHQVTAASRSFQVIARSIETGPTPGGWVLVTRDVTQQREIEQRIQQQERLAAVGQLAAGIAHDFNNIMATIVLYAQMTARMEGLPVTVRERMETIDGQAKHATNLIQQILDFSRRAVLERQPLDLLPLLKEQVKLLRRTLPEYIEIKLDYEPDEYVVNADPTRMQQMVTNLALNARDAMPEGGTLRIGLERIEVKPGESPLLPEMEPGEWVQVTVSDTGMGISQDVLSYIFDPFFTTKEPGEGSGLGLAQVYGIVGSHDGRIGVETQVGQGTTFTIYLPALPLHPPESHAAGLLKEPPSLIQGLGETVLVVEDNPVARQALAESLEGLNYRVLEAADGQEALVVLEQRGQEIALVLSDVMMPRMGGIALLHAMKERGLLVPVVMLTGHPLEKEMEQLRTQGLLEWLPKPSRLEELAQMLARALGTD